ncbi:MAG: DUF3375 domain-containing protein, partial [Acidipropionibacterium jensenii]|nr:DUF3375 domain-containing protein [Acidipropionibacterium jensenii]
GRGGCPCHQGLASVVGLLVLAEGLRRGPGGCTRSRQTEALSWQTSSETVRAMTVPRYIISMVPPEWSSHVPAF